MSRKTILVLTLVAALALSGVLMVGCSKPDPDSNHLILAWTDDPPTFDTDRTTWAQMTQSIFYDSLVEKDMEGNISPRLAHSWDISEDGKTWTFYLRDDVSFHDGTHFDANAVKFRLDRMMNPERPSANAHMIAAVKEVTVDDTYTVTFHLDPADGSFWDFLGSAAFGAIFSPTAVELHGEDFGQNPVGTGPWMMHEYVPGSHLTVRRNEDYKWGAAYWENKGAANFEFLTFRFIPDEATRMLELQQGSVDYSPIPPQEVERLRGMNNIQLVQYPSNGIRYWGFNVNKWPFTDVKVRQALQYAINKEEIVEFALEGLAQPLWSSLPPSIAGYSEELEAKYREMYPYEPAKTRELLEANGWTMGPNNIYVKDGKPFSVSMWVRNNPIEIRVGEMMINDLAQVGVELKLEVMEQGALTSGTPQGLHESVLWMYGWYDPDILYHVFNNGGTRMHHRNAQLQKVLEDGRSLVQLGDRLPYYVEAQDLLAEQVPWVVLYFPEEVIGFSQKVTNVRVNPYIGGFILHDLRPSR